MENVRSAKSLVPYSYFRLIRTNHLACSWQKDSVVVKGSEVICCVHCTCIWSVLDQLERRSMRSHCRPDSEPNSLFTFDISSTLPFRWALQELHCGNKLGGMVFYFIETIFFRLHKTSLLPVSFGFHSVLITLQSLQTKGKGWLNRLKPLKKG